MKLLILLICANFGINGQRIEAGRDDAGFNIFTLISVDKRYSYFYLLFDTSWLGLCII